VHAQINGIAVYYEDTASSGTAIVFIHGFPFNHTTWDPQWEAFKGSFRLVRYDQRGHGQSDTGDGQFPLEFLVDDLIGLLDSLKIPKAVLCGLSMGGYVALRAVERNPERVAGLVLCDTKSEADTTQAKISRSNAIKTIKNKSLSEFCEPFLANVLAPETRIQKPEIVEAIRKIIMGNSAMGICGALLALAGRTDTTDALPAIKVPTLILVGEKDTVTPPLLSEKMKAAIPQAKMAIISSAGHLSNYENPYVFNQHLKQFLDQLKS